MQIAAPLSIPRPVRRFLPAGGMGRKPVLMALLIVAGVVGAGVVIYQRVFATAAPPPVGQMVPVARGNVAATVSATGSVVATKQAKLVFANSGRIKEVLVSVGDQVTAGQPLARLMSDVQQNKLDTAKSQLLTAQLKLQQLTETATAEDVAAAQAAFDAATAKLNDLQNGPTAAELQAAQSAVVQAQATLDEANGKLQTISSGATSADRANAQAALVTAQNSLSTAQAKLDQLQAGPTNADTTSARNAVNDAGATLRSAQAKLDLLMAGPTQADLTAAQSSFDKAEADLTNARIKLDQTKMPGSLPPDVIAAQATLAAAETKLHTAHQSLDQLSAQLQQANADLSGAQSKFNSSIKSADQTCSKLGSSSAECAVARSATDGNQSAILKAQQTVKLLTGDGSWTQLAAHKDVLAAQASYDQAAATLRQAQVAHNAGIDLIAAQQTYDAAVSAHTAARAKLDQTRAGATNAELVAAQSAAETARNSLATAHAKLDQLLQGATDADTVAATTAVQTAEANVESAQAKLDALGVPTPQDLQSARSVQASAKAGLETARTKLAQLLAGPTQADLQSARSGVATASAALATKSGNTRPTDLALAHEAVHQAELSVQQAQIDLDNNTLVAPFDGVVGAIAGNPGETAAGGDKGFLTLVDPREVRVDVTVDETDVAKLVVGQTSNITFDALPGRPFRGKVISIAPSGTITQGVVSYPVSLSIDTRNQVLPAGLTASSTITIEEKNDVLRVPTRAVRRQGGNQIVEVPGEDGKPTQRPVKTGVQNDTFVEIMDGLNEGEQVLIAGTTTRSPLGPRPGGGPGPGPQPVMVTR